MKRFSLLAVGLGMLTAFSQPSLAEGESGIELAARKRYCKPCPPYRRVRPCPPGHVAPQPVAPPQDAHPADLPEMGDMPDPMADPMAEPMPEPLPQPPIQPNPPAPNLPSLGAGPSLSSAGQTGGAFANNPGRLDANNRLNLFDNMSAIPQSRVFFSYLNAEGQNAQLFNTRNGALVGTGANRVNASVYRFGVELAITEDFSAAFQGQQYNVYDTENLGSDFTNPQLMLKYVVFRDTNTVVSGTLGYLFDFAPNANVISDTRGRVYPGMLYYTETGDVFSNGGFQFGIPITGQDAATFDWTVGTSYWVYRSPSLKSGGYGCDTVCCNECCCDGGKYEFIQGVAPGIYLFGKHVLGDATGAAFNSSGAIGSLGTVVLEEERHVYDVTAAVTTIFLQKWSGTVGYSFPITGADQRRGEFIATVNYNF